MGQYRLKANAGAHHHSDGRTYGPGDVVTSKDNLALIFREKFEVVDGPQPVFVGPAGGRTGNELPQDHAGRDVWENDQEADNQAKTDNADLDENDGVDTDKEDLAENIAQADGSGDASGGSQASAGRPKRTPSRPQGDQRSQSKARSTR